MNVKISDYGFKNDKNFIEYSVKGLSQDQKEFLKSNLEEELTFDGQILKLTMYFDDKLYPFASDVAKIRMDDFISREEIEMLVFLSGFLEDMEMSE
ncbi:MAG: hypothetical protein IJ122_04060 [Methanobrevibacter sp.]|nr:hypothetical protein [Methanobrevibacter sp.]